MTSTVRLRRRVTTSTSTSVGAVVAAVATTVAAVATTGCAGDPPSAVVGIEVTGCSPYPEVGSGMFVTVEQFDEPVVLTAAHVLKGAREITVTRDDVRGRGTIIAFDPDMDLALVAVDGVEAPFPWTVDSASAEEGDRGVAYVVRDGEAVTVPITIARRVRIRTEDIYINGETLRPGYELTADIGPGDSGGAVVVDGSVVGVVWARSRRSADRAYAIDPERGGDLVGYQLDSGDLSSVDLTRCS